MPRMQVYLPEDLHALVKEHGLPASELLQEAVRAEVKRRELVAEGDAYVAALEAEIGPPSARQRSRAEAIVRQILREPRRKVS